MTIDIEWSVNRRHYTFLGSYIMALFVLGSFCVLESIEFVYFLACCFVRNERMPRKSKLSAVLENVVIFDANLKPLRIFGANWCVWNFSTFLRFHKLHFSATVVYFFEQFD